MTSRWQQPFSREEIEAMRGAARSEEGLAGDFWDLLKRVGRRIPFAEDVLAVFYCAFDPATPPRVKGILIGALAYFILPFDAIPDFLPIFGFTDDAAVIAAAIAMVRAHITPAHWQRARDTLGAGDIIVEKDEKRS